MADAQPLHGDNNNAITSAANLVSTAFTMTAAMDLMAGNAPGAAAAAGAAFEVSAAAKLFKAIL